MGLQLSYLISLLDLHCLGRVLHNWEYAAPGAKIVYVWSGCVSLYYLPVHSGISMSRQVWSTHFCYCPSFRRFLWMQLICRHDFFSGYSGFWLQTFFLKGFFWSGSSIKEVFRSLLQPTHPLPSLLIVKHLSSCSFSFPLSLQILFPSPLPPK